MTLQSAPECLSTVLSEFTQPSLAHTRDRPREDAPQPHVVRLLQPRVHALHGRLISAE